MRIIETCHLTCPHCGHTSFERMPTDACQYFFDCRGCGEILKPNAGDCCVFCSHGTVKCPPMQIGQDCCADPPAGRDGENDFS